MITQIIEKTGVVWQSGPIGKIEVIVGIFGAVVAPAVIFAIECSRFRAIAIDRKSAMRHKASGTVMRKYLELPNEDGCREVEDSPEARGKGVRFMIDIHCAQNIIFSKAVCEDLFDRVEHGDQLPVVYEVMRLSGNALLIEVPVTAWQWEDSIDRESLH